MYEKLDSFNPDVEVLNEKHRDFLYDFNCGDKYRYTFNSFIKKNSYDAMNSGEGVTYLVFNNLISPDTKELVAYYTISTTSIPYIDRIKADEEEALEIGELYNEKYCGISSIEIKMFAVSKDYQDKFFELEGETKPISAWILNEIIDFSRHMSINTIAFRAIFLHAVPEAELFYEKNNFSYIESSMKPFYSVDSDCKPMYYKLQDIKINYDE